MLEGYPGNEPFAAELPVVPGEHLELGLLGRISEELDKVLYLDAGAPRCRPELDREREDAVGVVAPVVEGAGYELLRFVPEVVVDGEVRVTGESRAPLPQSLVDGEVVLGHLVVWPVGVGPQDRAAEGVIGVEAEDVLVVEEEVYLGP